MKEIVNPLRISTELQGKYNRYRILKALGQGAFGITYLAEIIPHSGKTMPGVSVKIAIKEFFIKSVNGRDGNAVTTGSKEGLFAEYKRKFLREAQNLSKMRTKNIVHVLEAFEENNTVYYSMEYIDGGSLDDYIEQKGMLSESESITIIKQIAKAISYMHSLKMLHLDLKPLNVMRKSNGDIVLIDFGLSKQYDEKGEPESGTEVGCGTPGYAPIEQANYKDGHGFPVTMDIYALGATLYKMLTGHRPPVASDVLNGGLPMGLLHSLSVSVETQVAIARAMEPMKNMRPQSVGDFLKMLPCEDSGSQAHFAEEPEESTIIDDEQIDVEVVSNPTKCKTGQVVLGKGTNLIKCTFQNPKASNNEIKSYIIAIEPKRISLWYIKGDGAESKHTYFLSSERFTMLLEDINQLQLRVVENPLQNSGSPQVDLEAWDSGSNVIDCSTFRQYKAGLDGNVDGLCLLFERLANINGQIMHAGTPWLSKFLYVLSHNKLLAFFHCLLSILVVFLYININPWNSYIENTYNTQSYTLYGDNDYYEMSVSDGMAGVIFKPENRWVVNPKYPYEMISGNIYATDVTIYNARCGYANIRVKDKEALFSPEGEMVIPFRYDVVYFLSDNVIKCWNWEGGRTDYYNLKGELIGDDIVVFDDKYGWAVNIAAVICLLIICNMLLFRYQRSRCKRR